MEIFAAYIPASKQALKELQEWIRAIKGKNRILRDSNSPMMGSASPLTSDIYGDGDICYRVDTTYYYTEDGVVKTLEVVEVFECGSVGADGGGGDDQGDPFPPGGGNGDGSGGGGGDIPCDQQLDPTGNCTEGPGGGGRGGPLLGDDSNNTAEVFESKINDENLNPCMKDELNKLLTINSGVGEILQAFAIDMLFPDSEIENMNWTIEEKELGESKNATTIVGEYNAQTKTVTSYIDTRKFRNATSVSIAQTLLHEALHAYVVYIHINTDVFSGEPEKYLGSNWKKAFDPQDGGHEFMSEYFRNELASTLEAFSGSSSLDSQFFQDMAWGGFTDYESDEGGNVEYDFFKKEIEDPSERERIKNVIHIEQYHTDTNDNYKSQKGEDAGC